jgi:hypothetical protein
MKHLSRSTALKIAAILSFLYGVYIFVAAIPYLARGANVVDAAVAMPPYFVIVSAFIFAILRMIGAYGVWKEQRWGVIITILANAIDSILALPGLFFAGSIELWLSSAISIAVSVVVIVLCLWRDRKDVTTSHDVKSSSVKVP